jgi:MFS family permease
MAALMCAVFTVSVGFGVVLPLLPYLIERLLGAGAEAAQVSRHTGLLTAVYTLSLFLFAPMWGRLSDRRGTRCDKEKGGRRTRARCTCYRPNADFQTDDVILHVELR